ncbi:uncharacterized protein LOC124940717 [Impatiens glandulifera]|uniref:uncharacterized protein LOC124940717 n=1 Tax=Impatiens glandulifera TaxID=253017 RepID=UPI001FB0768F|nr:uncharacterized protein LOC124940717 [Impatiens glandulifera]
MNTGIHPNFPQQYMMPPNFGMQYLYNHPYMSYGYPPISVNNFHVAHTNYPNSEQPNDLNTLRFSSGSTNIPTQISLGDVDGNTLTTFFSPTQQSTRKSYNPWSTEDNKALLNGYFYFSNDSELGRNQKGDTFWECRTKYSGWSDDNYVEKALEYYRDNEKQRFSMLEEWKMWIKEKIGGDEVKSSAPSIVRPEGRDTTKKKARKASTSRKSKAKIDEKLSNVASTLENFKERRASTALAMLEYARVKKMEMLMSLKIKEERDVVDENTYQMLLRELFPN